MTIWIIEYVGKESILHPTVINTLENGREKESIDLGET